MILGRDKQTSLAQLAWEGFRRQLFCGLHDSMETTADEVDHVHFASKVLGKFNNPDLRV